MNPIELGKFIASLRNDKKLTQEELADMLFIDKRKISRWECGMSIPDFDMLIKLSEILDVSLYELSICKKLDKEKISQRTLNKFKSIKDFKKYKLKKKLLIIFLIILGIFFTITAIYTFKYYGTVEIYDIVSTDEKYDINGIYIHTDDHIIFNINKIHIGAEIENALNKLNQCDFEIYSNDYRLFKLFNSKKQVTNNIFYNNSYLELFSNSSLQTINNTNKNLSLKIICKQNKEYSNISIKFKLVKFFDNKLF